MKVIALRDFEEKRITKGGKYDYKDSPNEGIGNVLNDNGHWVSVRRKDFITTAANRDAQIDSILED